MNRYKYKGTDGNGGFIEGTTDKKYGSMLMAVEFLQKITHSLIYVERVWD